MVEETAEHLDRPALLVTVDTEEDQWGPSGSRFSTENIHALPLLHRVFSDLGLRPTYFTSYQVAEHRRARDVLRGIAQEGKAEIGAHLHPWNTPPIEEDATARNSMLSNLPADLQLAKLRVLTESLRSAFGTRPVSFRAGRFGFGRDTAAALIACGYEADCSVAPYVDLRDTDEGPDFSGAPLHPYRLAGDGDVTVPQDEGSLIEIPISIGYTRYPFPLWDTVHRNLAGVKVRGRALWGVLSHFGLVRKVTLEPEIDGTRDMIRLADRLVRRGLPHLQILLHSSTLVPGLTPFVKSRRDAQRFLRRIERFVSGLRTVTPFRPMTVAEFAGVVRAQHSLSRSSAGPAR